jgi:hypothetical protein
LTAKSGEQRTELHQVCDTTARIHSTAHLITQRTHLEAHGEIQGAHVLGERPD